MSEPKLDEIVAQVHKEEKTGFVNKETLLRIVLYRSNHTDAEINKDPVSQEAYDLLFKYRMLKLMTTSKYVIPFYVQKELKKPYSVRCSRCGKANINKNLSEHIC